MPDTHYSDAEIAAALDACAREPVHIPGAIQPMGCLVSLDANLERIRQVSANIEDYLGISVADTLAGEPREVLGAELMDLLETELVKKDNSASVLTATAQGEIQDKHRRYHVVAYPSGDAFVVELEYQMCPDGHRLLDKVNDWLVEVGQIDDIKTLLDALTRRVQELTGHERVMVYRFDEQWNGRVIAETRLPVAESFLDHHFPASDIPAQVRRLYDMNRVRSIPDASAAAVPLVPPCGPDEAAPLDMSRGVLRAAAPIHQEYLTNMGVGASLSVAMHEEGKLWGLLACHGLAPRPLEADLRDALCALVQIAMPRMMLLRERADSQLLHGVHDSNEILSDESGRLLGPDGLVERHGEQWLELLGASGIALVTGKESSGMGALPAEENLVAMAEWLSRHQRHDTPWHTQALASTPLAPWQEGDLCGLLAVALPTESTHWLMLFRREQRHSRRWAGKPEDTPMLRDGQLILTPRRSFAQWQDVVSGHSRAWRAIECRAAGDLAKNLAVLTSSHEIAQLNERLHHANRKLKSLAYTDSLTGTWNRYRMEQAIDAELNAAIRHDRPFAVLLFDIDHFKHFNDTHGHEAGDEVLTTLCQVLQNNLRPTDNLGRWGGEEFLVLASDCDLIGGVHLAERLRQSTEELDLGNLGGVTISVGVAAWRPGESRKTLVARADRAMYQAKEGGRNRVEQAPDSATQA
ncbi:sensor domain-containing diguanylate cyclase [Halomonas daqiaonensis]|uniref:diguanylate cyclase n=1 Tax=Halomonas daqiaonensis TaxID=650850 RepID=A0A1H7JG85_9GAMM|nr:sensor domain-containing diguanylate cyclase [Halomonas daqiaonensis]SEK73668.1 diguanylate cyclase (GGDEF) domain-containing protein [Halomonas daqiaonensis]